MTKKQIKLTAKVYAAVVIYNALETDVDSELFTENCDLEELQEELYELSEKLIKKLPSGISLLGFTNLDDIVNYAKKNA